jgi:hypothetical protein
VPFKISSPPPKSGTAPKITKLTGPPDNSLLIGQPWLMTAEVEDPENDVLIVAFSVYRAGRARWWFMLDDGSSGDMKANDGIYSLLRVGGDFYDGGELGEIGCRTVQVSVQAMDLRGNWSAPVTLEYQLAYDQPPLWMQASSPDGPNITKVNLDRQKGFMHWPLVTAACDTADAWVCARMLLHPDLPSPLLDDGKSADAIAGDGEHSILLDFSPSKYSELVLYAVSKSVKNKTGQRKAVICPPLGD